MYRKHQFKKQSVMFAWFIFSAIGPVGMSQTDHFTVDSVRESARQDELRRLAKEEQAQGQVHQRKSWLKRTEYVLGQLKETHESASHYFRKLDELLYDDQGKYIGRHGIHFNTYCLLKQYPVFGLAELDLKIAEASSYVNQIRTASQGPEVGYVPNKEICDGIIKLEEWTKARITLFNKDLAALGAMLCYKPQDVNLEKCEPLGDLVDFELSRPKRWHAQGHLQGKESAKPQVIDMHRQASREVEVQHAATAIKVIKAEEEQKNDQRLKESDIHIMQRQTDIQTKHVHAQEHQKDAMAELEIFKKDSELTRSMKQAEANRKQQIIRDQERRRELEDLAQSERVQKVLRPFTAKSHFLYKHPGTPDMQPVSLKRLQALGALETKGIYGLRVLTEIATAPQDPRPRWPFNMYYIKLSDKEKSYVKEAQDYLLELGDILVELEYLAP